jgi:hypothetical protein
VGSVGRDVGKGLAAGVGVLVVAVNDAVGVEAIVARSTVGEGVLVGEGVMGVVGDEDGCLVG